MAALSSLVLSSWMAAHTRWCFPDDWLLYELGALPLRGCFSRLVLSFCVAALLSWRSLDVWLIRERGTLPACGCWA